MPDVCLVVPCFNEARRLDGEAFIRFLHEQPRCAVCFVDDGSRDHTASVLDTLQARAPERIRVLKLARNQGKAEAVRQGVRHIADAGGFQLAGYWDADLSAPLSQVAALLSVMDQQPGCLLAMGCRFKRLGSDVRRTAIRHALGRVFATAASSILGMPVYDSQCGAKIFRTQAIEMLFADPFTTPWLFDVELLARLRNALGREQAIDATIEVPLTVWREVGGSKMSAAHMAAAPLGLLRIQRRYNGGR